MENYRTFLNEIASKLFASNKAVNLYRMIDGKLRLIDADSDFVYLKPDYGWNAKQNPYIIMAADREIASFVLYEFPSCCAFCVSTKVNTVEWFRKLGINKITNRLRQWIAKETGYTALICTDIESNAGERKTLIANGFKDIYKVQNKRTGNVVFISLKEL